MNAERICAVSIPSSSGHQFTGITAAAVTARLGLVSIPSSSGHQFTGCGAAAGKGGRVGVSIPSSSGHQFTAVHPVGGGRRRGRSFNPFFIRASVYWDATITVGTNALTNQVSIPSSSGHQFTGWRAPTSPASPSRAFQSLLHQGISLLGDNQGTRHLDHSAFQSLLHQGISLLSISSACRPGS